MCTVLNVHVQTSPVLNVRIDHSRCSKKFYRCRISYITTCSFRDRPFNLKGGGGGGGEGMGGAVSKFDGKIYFLLHGRTNKNILNALNV